MTDDSLIAYLFVLDSSQSRLVDTIKLIDGLREVENWQIILPDAAVLISRLDLKPLSQEIKSLLPGQRYIIVPLERKKKEAWLARSSWDFINEPT